MEIKQLVNNQTHVSITLANHLFSKECSNTNIVFSPLSIQVALSFIAAGSKGRTLDQLLAFLKTNTVHDLNTLSSQLVSLIMADGSSSGGPRLSFANGVWVEQTLPLKPSFKQILVTVHNATCKQVDFLKKAADVVDEVNLWAETQTSGLIKDVVPYNAVNNATKLIFANAVYFKGVWNQKFDPSNTKDLHFHLLDGSKVEVPFMTSYRTQLIREYDGFKVLGLPYSQGEDKRRFTMYLLLPNEKDGLPYLIEKMCSESDFLDHHMPHQRRAVGQFYIPKFKISFRLLCTKMLQELGLVLPFTGGEGLTEISVGENLYVSGIYHKSFVEVNEEGTEAAAVTVVLAMPLCSWEPEPEPKVDFVADHPFLFVIKEDMSGAVLFMGQVIDPRVA